MAVSVGSKKGAEKAEPNVVPLCDVLLVLLIIFNQRIGHLPPQSLRESAEIFQFLGNILLDVTFFHGHFPQCLHDFPKLDVLGTFSGAGIALDATPNNW